MKNGLIVDKDGTKRYYLNDLLHREDGPAVESTNGEKLWWFNDLLHRIDGPAVELENHEQHWFLYDKQLIHPKEFKNMEEWFKKLNTDEEYSLKWINKFKGLIEIIKNPTPKQKRLHAIKWKI